MYQQRQEHPAAGSDENACIEGQLRVELISKLKEERNHLLMKYMYLMISCIHQACFQVWRTGADELAYEAAEDEGFDVSQ